MDFPIVPSKTAMLFFDTLSSSLHPEDPAAQAAVNESGYIPRLQSIESLSGRWHKHLLHPARASAGL